MSIYGVTGGGGGGASINDATVSQSSVWSSYRTAGALAGKVTAGGSASLANLIVGGDLTVSGTTTTVNSETLVVNDAVIDLNNLAGPAPEVGIRAILPSEPGETRLVYDATLDEWACSTLADGSIRPLLVSRPTADLLNGYPLVWNATERALITPQAIPQLVAVSVKTPSIIAADPQDGLTIEGLTVVGDIINNVDIVALEGRVTTAEDDIASATATANAALPKAGGALTGPVMTTSTIAGVDIAARDAVLTSTTATANAALPKAGGALTGPVTTTSTIAGVDIAARDAVLTTTAATANGALQRSGGTMTGTIAMGANSITLAAGGLVDGVDVSARDAVLTTTTTTANGALQRSGGTMTGVLDMGANAIATASTVDGVDISARDAILTSTTTTADGALQRSGGTMTGPLTVTSIQGLEVDIAVPGFTLNNAGASVATVNNIKLRRLWKVDTSGYYFIRINFTMTANTSTMNGYIPEFTGYGLSASVVGLFNSAVSPVPIGSVTIGKYTPDGDGLVIFTNQAGNFSQGTTYNILGGLIMVPGFD